MAAAVNRRVIPNPFRLPILIACMIPVLSGCWGSPNSDGSSSFDLKAIVIDPSTPTTLYVGTDGGGVVKSTDGGASWAPMNVGLTDLKVTALAIDWFTPSRIYAGTENGGLFSSLDYGESWFPQAPITDIRAIVIDRNFCPPTPPCRGVYVASQTSGVWRSTDGGLTFSLFIDNLSNTAVTAMAIYPTVIPDQTTSRLYVGTEGTGMEGPGVFWRRINPLPIDPQWTDAGLPGLKEWTLEEPVSMAVNPLQGSVSDLYVGTSGGGETGSGKSGIYRSINSGTNFDPVYDPNFPFTIYFVVPVVGPNTSDLTLYAGSDTIVWSQNFGIVNSWCMLSVLGCKNPLQILSPGLTAFAVALSKHTDVDGNVSFLVDTNPIPPPPPTPAPVITLYAALFNRQLIKSTDGGQTWTTLSLQ